LKEIYGIKTVDYKGEKKDFWIRIGIAHVNKDGSLNCSFDYFPRDTNIKIHIRDPKENKKEMQNDNDEFTE